MATNVGQDGQGGNVGQDARGITLDALYALTLQMLVRMDRQNKTFFLLKYALNALAQAQAQNQGANGHDLEDVDDLDEETVEVGHQDPEPASQKGGNGQDRELATIDTQHEEGFLVSMLRQIQGLDPAYFDGKGVADDAEFWLN